MARKEELWVNLPVPSYFRCPISLDLMKSPVSLCTGITYDRSSIQRWLDDGNATCPATMQPLPTTDLVPNLTLLRLIHLYTTTATSSQNHLCRLLHDLHTSNDPLPSLRQLASIASDSEGVRDLAENVGCVSALCGVLEGNRDLEVLVEAVRVLALVLAARAMPCDRRNQAIVQALLAVLREGKCPESRTGALKVLEWMASAGMESKLLLAETEGLLSDLARLIADSTDPVAVDASLSCLIAISSAKRVPSHIVQLGIVPALGKLLCRPSTSAAAAEKSIELLATASMYAEGRAAICEDAGCVVAAMVGKMMKVSMAATEQAVTVLWRIRHLYRDRRAQEAVAGNGGLKKILLLMQSSCSANARQLGGDLLKIFRGKSKMSCIASYDSITANITPF